MYETTSQGRLSLHSSTPAFRERASTPGRTSEHDYVDYHEFQDMLLDHDTSLLHSPVEKIPSGRLAFKEDTGDGSVRIANALYSPPGSSRMRDSSNIYEIDGEFPRMPPPENPLVDSPSTSRAAHDPEEHIYEAEPLRQTLADPLYSTADYAEVDARDSGLGTLSLSLCLPESQDDSQMVENELYVPSQDQSGQTEAEGDEDTTVMVDNVLYQSQS